MPLNAAGETYNRLLNASERDNLHAYLLAHPDADPRDYPATLAGYAGVQDWIDAGRPSQDHQ